MRLSSKTIINQTLSGPTTNSDFDKPEFEGAIRYKGYDAIFEKAYLCPCKSQDSPDHLSTCQNCGGVGWIFCNPTKTKFIITGIAADSKLREAALREWGLIDGGVVNVTALNENKLSYMDRIRLLDATAEHNQILYPKETDDETQFFAYTHYDIVSIDNITLFVNEETQLQRLSPNTDYSFRDNVITFTVASGVTVNSHVGIRYVHNPVFHIIDVVRESMTSPKTTGPVNQQKQIMPIKAIAKRAHLIKDVENFDGDRLLDNSWLPQCPTEDITAFQRQLRYMDVQVIYDTLTQVQKDALEVLLDSDDSV